ncbi:MAG TPA: Gfo/Idh/MocA family oxidoreductase [Solirubrobacteraceae bacterium]|jgi:predicted dehydrogenase|nr:Gfo/Idh/MocA family oxidoreductase [Solirubrobacteraceae bacterium]
MRKPRIGFLGVGHIGTDRLIRVRKSGLAEIAAAADQYRRGAGHIERLAPEAAIVDDLDEMLAAGVDGVVICTPNTQHADQSVQALEAGVAVFCQKPLAPTPAEVERVVETAKRVDGLLGVDFTYRGSAAATRVRDCVRRGTLGDVYSVDLAFQNAGDLVGRTFLDPAKSGGGCVLDLGTHLVDLLLWSLGWPEVEEVRSCLWTKGRPTEPGELEEDCLAHLSLAGGVQARLACSWFAHEGRPMTIEAAFRGPHAAAALYNFPDKPATLAADVRHRSRRDPIARPPDEWEGRATLEWVRRVARGKRFDRSVQRAVDVARVVSLIRKEPPTAEIRRPAVAA